MKKKLLIVSLSIGTLLWGNSPEIHHLDRQRDSMHHTILQTQKHQEHRKLDNQFKHKKLMRRTFKDAKEFKRLRNRNHRQAIQRGNHYASHSYGRDFGHVSRYVEHDYTYARGTRHWKNRWYMIYKYERAGFFDNEGFFYGYFNHRGYMFEGEFYRYDRYYTYRDRVRGRGLFCHRYFRPQLDVVSYNEYDDNCRGC